MGLVDGPPGPGTRSCSPAPSAAGSGRLRWRAGVSEGVAAAAGVDGLGVLKQLQS
jgi:hypothetical protein